MLVYNFRFAFVLLVCFFVILTKAKVDETKTPLSNGEEVVETVIDVIHKSKVFIDDNELLKRLAIVQSRFGNDKNVYKENTGGIWQITKTQFHETKDVVKYPKLEEVLENISRSLIYNNWTCVDYVDLDKPLYSAIAARLYIHISSNSETVDIDLSTQGKLWEKIFKNNLTLNSDYFESEVTKYEENHENVCQNKPMDLCFVIDSSGSIWQSDFQKEKDFVIDSIKPLRVGLVRVGTIFYTGVQDVAFPIDNILTNTSMIKRIQSKTKPASGVTWTGQAIFKAVELFKNSAKQRDAQRIMVVITDGNDNGKKDDLHNSVEAAHKENITTIVIGIHNEHRTKSDDEISDATLKTIAHNVESNIFRLTFNTLNSFLNRLNYLRCQIPENLDNSKKETKSNLLGLKEKRYYNFKMPSEGLTIDLDASQGYVNGFYSYTFERPSNVFYDGKIFRETFVPPPANVLVEEMSRSTLFVTVQGQHEMNNFTIKALPGKNKTIHIMP